MPVRRGPVRRRPSVRRPAARGRAASLVGMAASVLLTVTACSTGSAGDVSGGAGDEATAGDPVAVATTTQLGSVLADITACTGTTSATLMGPGDDPHDFSPSSRQIAGMTRAGLVVTNGLGLEGGLGTALDNARSDGAQVLEVAPAVDPLPFAAGELHGHGQGGDPAGHDHGGHEHGGQDHGGHEHGGEDPHFWMDVARMATAAEVIGTGLAEATGEERYAACGEEVAAALEATDQEVREILAGIPEDRRTLVTDHAAYNYFAEAYGFEVAGVVVPGGSTEAEPSSEQLADLVSRMEEEGADALVRSAGSGNRLVEALSAESGGEVPVVELYEGGVGPDGSGVETYAEAMVHNARTLADTLS